LFFVGTFTFTAVVIGTMMKRVFPSRSSGGFSSFPLTKRMSPLARVSLFCLCCLGFSGVLMFFLFFPSENTANSPSTNSIINTGKTEEILGFTASGNKLSKKILDWIPHSHHVDASFSVDLTSSILPEWEKEFWTPIDVDISSTKDPIVILCKLNYKKYYEQPHSYPMFRDLESLSSCIASNRKREKLSVLLADIKSKNGTDEGRVITPSGFVFHESRVGSTLIANFLASDPYSLVFSESTPIANAILHCTACSKETHIKLFRDVVTLMGRSPIHKRLFVKFQSITVTNIHIALEVRLFK
jgi:hypothetical protein